MPDDDRGSDGESDDDDDDEDEDDEEDEDGADDEDGATVKLNACPNLRNPYHECTAFCAKKWGAKSFNPDKGEFGMAKYVDWLISQVEDCENNFNTF